MILLKNFAVMFYMNSKIDVLYILKYDENKIKKACSRLLCSIKSIYKQPVNIIIVNYSRTHIDNRIISIPGIQYYHHPSNQYFSRAKSINYAVKKYIKSEYFAISDIDLVYHSNHFKKIYLILNSYGRDKYVRLVNYNYNIKPQLLIPYTSCICILKRLKKYSSGGYAHGNGIIHLKSFIKIQGYDEELIGYGPEDDLFNCRIGKINKLLFIPDDELTTYHLWHEMNSYDNIQYNKNMEYWLSSKVRLWGLACDDYDKIIANTSMNGWGEN